MGSLVLISGQGDGAGRELQAIDNGDGTWSLAVNLVGGAVGGQVIEQGDPNAGGADAWPVASKTGAELALDATALAGNVLLTTIADRLADLAPPVGGSITGDDAAHAFGALTGPGIIVVAATGGTARIGAAAEVSNTVGLPVVDGASYDGGGRRYAAIEANKVYVPVGVTVVWGAHQ